MGRAVARVLTAAALPVMVVAATPAGAAGAQARPHAGAGTLTARGVLNDVAASSARNAWAVGRIGFCQPAALLARWNGTGWKVAPSPAGARHAWLDGVAVTSASNAWAVGFSNLLNAASQSVTLRWNGAVWKRVATPGAKGGATLTGVAATSAASAWAVGTTNFGQTFTLRWNGATWKHVPSSSPRGFALISGVAAASQRVAWAVGGTLGSRGQGFILRWTGTAWTSVRGLNLPQGSFLSKVAVTSAGNAWAVGETGNNKTLIMAWNGTTWQRVASPSVTGELNGVTAVSARDAWAVGDSGGPFDVACPGVGPRGQALAGLRSGDRAGAGRVGGGGSTAKVRPLIFHWNGRTWTQVAGQRLPGPGGLIGVIATSASNAWAVGCACANLAAKSTEALVLRWNGRFWK